MDFFFGVVGDVARAGRSVIDFRPDFQQTILGLASENDELLAEIQASERFRKAMQKFTQRAQGTPGAT
jgi:hypothetical protein